MSLSARFPDLQTIAKCIEHIFVLRVRILSVLLKELITADLAAPELSSIIHRGHGLDSFFFSILAPVRLKSLHIYTVKCPFTILLTILLKSLEVILEEVLKGYTFTVRNPNLPFLP